MTLGVHVCPHPQMVGLGKAPPLWVLSTGLSLGPGVVPGIQEDLERILCGGTFLAATSYAVSFS